MKFRRFLLFASLALACALPASAAIWLCAETDASGTYTQGDVLDGFQDLWLSGSASWAQAKTFIGQDANNMTAYGALWKEDAGNNKRLCAVITNYPFTATGRYYLIEQISDGTTWTCTSGTAMGWNENTTWPPSGWQNQYFTVEEPGKPAVAATVSGSDVSLVLTPAKGYHGGTSAVALTTLVVRATTSALTAQPVNGTAYALGASLGGGTVVAKTAAATASDTGLADGTYYYFAYACNNDYYGTAASTSATVSTLADPDPEVSVSGETALTTGEAISLTYTASYFDGTPAWNFTCSPTIADAALSAATGNSTVFSATPASAGSYTVKVVADDGTDSVTNTTTLTLTDPPEATNLCATIWHVPAEIPPNWGTTAMRSPLAPEAGDTNLFLVVGSYAADSAGDNMTAGTVYVAHAGGAYEAHALSFDSEQRNSDNNGYLKFWAANIDMSAISAGGTLSYYFVISVDNYDDTYIAALSASDESTCGRYGSAASAAAAAFSVTIDPVVVTPEVTVSGTTALTLGTAASLTCTAANFTGTPAWSFTCSPTIADAALSATTGNSTVFSATPASAGSYTVKVVADDGTDSVTNTTVLTVTAAPVVLAEHVWHVPGEVPDNWGETTMRHPLSPAEGDTNLFLVVGSYAADSAGENMTTGRVYVAHADGAYEAHPLSFDSEQRNGENNGTLKFWAANIDVSGFEAGDTINYYFSVEVDGCSTTCIANDNDTNCTLVASTAAAEASPFSATFGAAPVLPICSNTVWHIPSERPGEWTTPMRNPLCPGEGDENVAVFVGTYNADTDGDDMTGGRVVFSTDDGATWATNALVYSTNSEIYGTEGTTKFWKNDLDTSALAEGDTLQYYFAIDVTGYATTYIASDGTDAGCVWLDDADDAALAAFSATFGEHVYNLGNCWHNPGNYEPWSDATMRNPCYPAKESAVCFFVGNQDSGEGGNPGNMSGGTLFWRYTGAATFNELALGFESESSPNKYWKAIIPATDLASAGDVEYYIAVTYADHDTTYLGASASGAGSATYATAEAALEHLYSMPVGDTAGSEPGYMWHAGNTVLAGTNAVQFWVKIGYTKDGADWADTVELRYNICQGAIPASVKASAKRLSAKSYRAVQVRSLSDYSTLAFTRDHEEEDTSDYGNSVWWVATLTDDALAEANTYVEYEIAAKNSSGNDTYRFADYKTASASNRFYYTMWSAGANELTVNGLNADYTTSKFFLDEAAGETATLQVVYNPPVDNPYAVEVFSNVGRRDYWNADLDENGIPDAIFPPSGDFYTTETTNGYYFAQAMTPSAGVGYLADILVDKCGAYRLTARYKATASDSWHYYSESGSGIRDHAVVVSPKKVLSQNVYELNALTVKATNATRSARSTFADLINPAAENQDTFDEFSIDYLNKIGANCLWFQPIHPATETGIDFDEGPGSPYAAKNYFAVARWFGRDETETGALAEFQQFTAACDRGYIEATNCGYVGTINIMLDGVFNHTSWDAVLGQYGVDLLAAKGVTTYTDENGETQTITATTPIGHVRPNWYAYWQNYGEPASFFWSPTNHDVATAPDRGDFGKWGDTAELFYGRYAALVEHNPDDNANYLCEDDWFDWSCMTNGATAELWDYMGGYAAYWLDHTGHDFGNERTGQTDENGAAYDDYGIDGLRCDFGQGLPPQFWEYCINRTRAKKWNFMFMAESLDGGVVSYRSNRHFDILNENFVFQAKSAESPSALQSVVESRKSLYNGGSVLLNLTSHDEVMPYDDPWVTAARYAVYSSFMGLPMTFYGQEQGIVPLSGVNSSGMEEGDKVAGSVLSGFSWHELNFGKFVPHFKSWNQLRIWDEPPSSVWASSAENPEEESRYMAQWYGRVNAARLRSSALRSSNQYYLGRKAYVDEGEGTYDNNSIFAVAKYEASGAADAGKDAILAFSRFMNAGDSHYAASETYAIPDEVASLLGISRGKSYSARNLASSSAETVLWTKTGDEILDEGIWVNLTTGEGSNMYDDGAIVQYLKLELASGIVFGSETNATNGVAATLGLTISDATGYTLSATANGESFDAFTYDGTTIAYTPTNAGSYVFTATATNLAGNVNSASATVTVAKGTPEFVAYSPIYGTVGETLANVTLADAYAWVDATTALTAVGDHPFDATYDPDPANWNSVTGALTVTVGKGHLLFVAIDARQATYATNLTLGEIVLPDGYSWAISSELPLVAGTDQYMAHYNPDPDNYYTADGYVTVVVAKATPEVEAPSGLTATVGQTLADVELPDGFAWDAPDTVLSEAGTVTAAWTYTPEDTDNWNTVFGTSDVAVSGGDETPVTPRTTSIVVDLAAGTVTLAGENFPEVATGNVWLASDLANTWTVFEGNITVNADGSYTFAMPEGFACAFFSVGKPSVME